MIIEEGELADEPIMAEEVERPEVDLVGGMALRFQESQLSLDFFQFMRKGWRCNNLGLPLY